MRVVVDANIVAMWILNEEYSELAVKLRDAYINGKIILYAPPLLRYEIVSVLWKAVKLRRIFGLDQALSALHNLLILSPKIIKLSRKDLRRALSLAIERNITTYDAVYLVLKEKIHGVFITADKKLYSKIKDIKDTYFITNVDKIV